MEKGWEILGGEEGMLVDNVRGHPDDILETSS